MTEISQLERARGAAASVVDPEIPVLTIEDLGVLREVRLEAGQVHVTLTPTYSGCPAMDAIRDDVRTALADAGFDDVEIVFALAPAWTTNWMSEAGKRKLEAFGIAPPTHRAGGKVSLSLGVKCPHCQSLNTRELSHFGSTSCKALYQCRGCGEPFDYFKVL